MPRTPTKCEDYRRFAADAEVLAAASSLDHVRAKHAGAAARWTALADLEEDRRRACAAYGAAKAPPETAPAEPSTV